MLQGWTVMTLPTASGDGAVKVEAVIVKMHEPKVVVPVAVLPPDEIENAGVVDVLVNATVVVAVVPNDVTPDGYAKEVLVTADVTAAEAAMEASDVAAAGAESPPPPPPPQALKMTAATAATKTSEAFLMILPPLG